MSNAEIDKPGQSDQLILPSEAIKRDPNFFEKRPQNWILIIRKPDGTIEKHEGVDWAAESLFGSVRSAVVTDETGKPVFDHPRYEEAPNVNIVAWGRDKNTGQIRVALISQPRPYADDPTDPENTKTLIFAQIPMGFKELIIGRDQLGAYESSKQAAARETAEETGASVIKNISQPEFPYHNPNPTFVGTWSDLVFVEVDLERIETLKQDRNEPIFKAEYIPLKQIWKELRAGKTERGITRMCTSNSALLIFFTYLGTLVKASKEREQS
jgi:hypothetical protein